MRLVIGLRDHFDLKASCNLSLLLNYERAFGYGELARNAMIQKEVWSWVQEVYAWHREVFINFITYLYMIMVLDPPEYLANTAFP